MDFAVKLPFVASSDELEDETHSESDEESLSPPIILPPAPATQTDSERFDEELFGIDEEQSFVQVCNIVRLHGRSQRTQFRAAKIHVQSRHMDLRLDSGQRISIPLFGGRAYGAQMRANATDPQPCYSENSIVFHPSSAGMSWVFACPSEAAKERLEDLLCHEGCIMRDLHKQVRLLPSDDMPDCLRLAEPKTARTLTNEDVVALKVACDEEKLTQLINELKVMQTLEHDAILRVHGMYELTLNGVRGLGLIADFKRGEDLSQWIPSGGMDEMRAKSVFAQMCCALQYLQGRRIIHRDIKPTNVFCEQGPDNSLNATLADFGLAACVDDVKKVSIRCGSAGYIAPEIFRPDWPALCLELESYKEDPDSKTAYENRIDGILKSDVFSLGMVLLSMTIGTNIFVKQDVNETYLRNARGKISRTTVQELPVQLQSLIGRLCQTSPSKRCSIMEASSHSWLN
jgi:serine/threonine protein kinase